MGQIIFCTQLSLSYPILAAILSLQVKIFAEVHILEVEVLRIGIQFRVDIGIYLDISYVLVTFK